MMALDQCIASTADEATARAALEITHRWAGRSLAARADSPQAMFAIVQGALFRNLRKESAARLTEMPFDGFAIGGLAVGEAKNQREELCEFTAELLPNEKPRYLMGVGTPLDILEAVHRGVDMFDCIIPTQVAQRGAAFTSRGYLQMRRGVYKFAEEKLDPECSCPTCGRYSRAYLHHLTKSAETLGWQLLGKHNIHFYHQLMREIRAAILADRFLELYRSKREFLHEVDADNPILKPRPNKKRSLSLGAYEVHIAREGFASMRHRASGEIMHSRTAPMEEAQRLYVEQSELAERLRDSTEPLVIWDIGLGAGANAMAAIHCYEKQAATGPVRPLQLISFENDLDSLKLALRLTDLFPYLRHAASGGDFERGPVAIEAARGIELVFGAGDFLETMKTAPARPDLIFYDMFSSKTCGDQWTLDTFAQLFAICRGRAVELFTYTCSTSARVALLAAGFHVAKGRNAGEKEETTIALTPEAAGARCKTGRDLLSAHWLEKWNRSGAKFPPELPLQEREPFERMIRAHEQFQSRR